MARDVHQSKDLDRYLGKKVEIRTNSGRYVGDFYYKGGYYMMKRPIKYTLSGAVIQEEGWHAFRKTHIKKIEVRLDDRKP